MATSFVRAMAAALTLILTAGCFGGTDRATDSDVTSDGQSPSSGSSGGEPEPSDRENPSEPPGEPYSVNVREPIGAGVDESWTWRVTSGAYTTFTVRVVVHGPADAPQFVAANIRVEVSHPNGQFSWGAGSGGLSLQSSAAPVTVYDYSGSNGSGQGTWTIDLTSGPGAAEYEVFVDLAY